MILIFLNLLLYNYKNPLILLLKIHPQVNGLIAIYDFVSLIIRNELLPQSITLNKLLLLTNIMYSFY